MMIRCNALVAAMPAGQMAGCTVKAAGHDGVQLAHLIVPFGGWQQACIRV